MRTLDEAVDVPVSEGRGLRLALALQTDPLPLLTRLNREHGPIVRLRVQPLIRALGQGLITSGAHLHRRQRRLIQPMFHRDQIDAYAASFVELTEAALDRWGDGEALTLLLPGHETTANALAWALYLLAGHPEEQERIGAELAALDGPATAADLPRLRRILAVVRESMRLYPPIWVTMRHLTEERTVAGYRLLARSTLLMSPWVVHRDPRWWPDPEQFRPERWLTPDKPPHRYAYFPFGGGPRLCIGNDFAITEDTLVLANILRRWRLHPVAGAPPVLPRAQVTLHPRDGIWLTTTAVGAK